MMTSAQLGLTAGRRVDHIYDFSGILGQDSVADQRVGSDSYWSQAKEILYSTFIHLIYPLVWIHKDSVRESTVPDSGLFLQLKAL